MTFDLFAAAQHHVQIVAHRGAAGGNIPCNTLAAYEAALLQGADMLEVDVSRSRDGVLFLFHPGMERFHLGRDVDLTQMDMADIRQLRYVNFDGTPTQFAPVLFDEFMEQFRGRCFINVDKFRNHPAPICQAIRRHGMEQQVLVKSAPAPEMLELMETLAPELMYMPVVSESHPLHQELMGRKLHYIGAEVLFSGEDSPLAGRDFIDRMHRDGKLVWVNAIIYDVRRQLAGGHSDDTAITRSPDYGWGWLADRNFDLIQTDWPGMLRRYLEETGRYLRRQDT